MIGKLQRFSHFIPKKNPFGLTDVSALMVLSLFFALLSLPSPQTLQHLYIT